MNKTKIHREEYLLTKPKKVTLEEEVIAESVYFKLPKKCYKKDIKVHLDVPFIAYRRDVDERGRVRISHLDEDYLNDVICEPQWRRREHNRRITHVRWNKFLSNDTNSSLIKN